MVLCWNVSYTVRHTHHGCRQSRTWNENPNHRELCNLTQWNNSSIQKRQIFCKDNASWFLIPKEVVPKWFRLTKIPCPLTAVWRLHVRSKRMGNAKAWGGMILLSLLSKTPQYFDPESQVPLRHWWALNHPFKPLLGYKLTHWPLGKQISLCLRSFPICNIRLIIMTYFPLKGCCEDCGRN